MQTQMIIHIRLYNIGILVLFVWIPWLIPNTRRKSKLSYTVKPRRSLLHLENFVLLNRHRIPGYSIVFKYIGIKLLFLLFFAFLWLQI